jgi:pyruvate dehydrogenase E1 component beta subunit
MPTMTMVEAIRDALSLEMARDPRVILLGQDIGRLGGVFRATEGLQARFGAERVVDMPLAEAAIVGAAVGLAVSGLIPVVEIQFLGFTHQAFHQMVQLARLRYRSRGRFTGQVTVRTAFGGNVRSPELHSDALEAHYTHCPGLKVVTPSNAYDAKGLLLASIRDPDPVLFCEPMRGYRLVKGEVPEGDYTVPIGRARLVREGKDVTLVAWSAAVQTAEVAAERLDQEDGISSEVLDLRTLVPLDIDELVKSVKKTGCCVVVHEASLTGGFGAEVVATLQEEAFYWLHAPIARVTAPDAPYPLAGVEQHYIPDVSRVVAAAREVVQAK